MGFAAWVLLHLYPHTFHAHLVIQFFPRVSSAVPGPSGQERKKQGGGVEVGRKDRLTNHPVLKTTSPLSYLLVKGNT